LAAAVISKGYPKVKEAKSQKYDRVYTDPDVAASFSRLCGASANKFRDEADIGYVAYTRL